MGVVVEAFTGGSTTVPGYIVEFMSMTGETIAVVDVTADAVRPVTSGDMPQARSFTRSS